MADPVKNVVNRLDWGNREVRFSYADNRLKVQVPCFNSDGAQLQPVGEAYRPVDVLTVDERTQMQAIFDKIFARLKTDKSYA